MAHVSLSPGEVEVLIDGLTDDVSFDWVLVHLGIRGNPPPSTAPPSPDDVEAAFASIRRLVDKGLTRIGRVEYIDRGPPGRVAPVEHLEEPMEVVRTRTEAACRGAQDHADWAYSCWLVNTERGDAAARHAMETEGTSQE